MAACRWRDLEKVTVQDFHCQVGNGNLKDAETQNEISIALSSPANSLKALAIKLCHPVNLCW